MAASAGNVYFFDDSDMEAQLFEEPIARTTGRQSVSRAGIMATLAVVAVLGCMACAHAAGQMSVASTQGLGGKVDKGAFAVSEVVKSSTTEEGVGAAMDLFNGVVSTAMERFINDTDSSSGDLDPTAVATQALSGIVGVLEEESDPNGTVHVRSGVWDLQNMTSGSDGAKAGQQLLKDVLENTGAVSDGKTPGLHAAAGALGGLLGVLDDVRSKQGNTGVDDEVANLGNPLAALSDMDLDQGQKGDEGVKAEKKALLALGALGDAAGALAGPREKGKDGEGSGEAKLEDPFAALDAWTGALAKAAEAADKGGSGDAAGKNADPFAALDAFAGAMAEQDGKGQKGDLSDKDSNPFEAMGALAGAMAGAIEERPEEGHKGDKFGGVAGQADVGSEEQNKSEPMPALGALAAKMPVTEEADPKAF